MQIAHTHQTVIRAEGLTKKFGNFTAVNAIDLNIQAGEIFGFLGANGAGKTTALKMLIGLSRPSAGRAEVAGIDVGRHPEAVKRRIGYMSQRFSLYEDLTVVENSRLFGGIYGLSKEKIQAKTHQLLQKLGLETYANRLVGDLPLGWKQKLAFSVALLHEPQVVFLDEPTGGVDPVTRRQFWEMIYEASAAGITVMVTTHYMDEAEYCHRASIMVDGRVAALGTPAELKQQFQAADMDTVFRMLARPSAGK